MEVYRHSYIFNWK